MKTYSTQQINACFIMTRGQAQATGTKVPEVHRHSKPLDPNLKPEKDTTLRVNSGSTASIPSMPAVQPNMHRVIPPVQLPVKVTPLTPHSAQTTPRKTPQIRASQTTPGSSGLFTPQRSAQTPIKEMITPVSGSTPAHILQTYTHSTPQTARVRSVNRGLDLDVPKFNLDPEPEESTQPPLLGNDVDFRHPSFRGFRAPQ